MERDIIIPSNGGFEISGLLANEKSTRLIIFVHGLSGSMTEAHYFAAKDYFVKAGFSVFRFNLYASGEKNRKLETSTIKHHCEDVSTVLTFFSSQFEEIYIVGHSLGGPSIIGVQKFPDNLQKIILWDPAFDTSKTILKCFEKAGVYLYIGNGKNIEISPDMFEEFSKNTHLDTLKKIPFETSKISCIYASEARHKDLTEEVVLLGIHAEVISGANHGFTQEGKYNELFKRTLYFLEN